MNHWLRFALICAAAALGGHAAAAEVVVSIKPLHSLVQAVLGGSATAQLLVSGAGSPHGYAIKPSQARMIHNADLVFYIDDRLENFLPPLLESAAQVQGVALAQHPDIRLLARATYTPHDDHDEHDGHGEHGEHDEHDDHDKHGGHDEHGGHDDHDDHDHGNEDLHIWLDPANAQIMVARIADILSAHKPENAALYQSNAEATMRRLQALDRELAAQLGSAADTPYIVFHDAYRYMTERYGLQAATAILPEPHRPLSAKRLSDIRRRIKAHSVRCIFSEPQFSAKAEKTIAAIADETVRIGELDPLGAALPAGEALYAAMMRRLAAALSDCLSP